jgi:hypothetical protein
MKTSAANRSLLGISSLCFAIGAVACADSSTGPVELSLPVALTATTVFVASPAGASLEVRGDSIALVIVRPNTCGLSEGASATLDGRAISISLTFAVPSVPVPCEPIQGATTYRIMARGVPTGSYDVVGDVRFVQAGNLLSDSILLRQSVSIHQ